MKKQLMLLALIISSSNLLADKFESLRQSTLAKLGVSVLAGGVAKVAGESASENKTIQKIGKSIGVNPKDVSKAGAIASGIVTFAALDNEQISVRSRCLNALALLGMTLSFYSPVQKVIKKVPLVGDFVDCDNHVCTGACKDCMLSKVAVGTVMGAGMRLFGVLVLY